MEKFNIFVNRLKKLGIETTYFGNYPWVYFDTINGKKVTEKFHSEHGWVVGYSPIRKGQEFSFTDITEIFKLIRKYETHIL